MKLNVFLVAFIVTVSAIPVNYDVAERNEKFGGLDTAILPRVKALAPGLIERNGGFNGNGGNRGGNRGGHRGQGNPAQAPPPPSPPQTVGNAPAAATNTATAAQPTNNGNNGQTGAAGNTGNGNTGSTGSNGNINPALVPDLGQQAGLQPDGTGNCKSNTGITIPCQCPPSRDAFIAKLSQFVSAGSFPGGGAAPFPTGNSNQDGITRLNTMISTLQNFDDKPGVGCPASAAPGLTAARAKLQAAG